MEHAHILDVTAVIPTCRRPVLLLRALRSVAAQEAVPAEIVIVNDGPPADLPAICEAVGESGCSRVVVVASTHPSGPSAARNAGAACASRTWLAFLDDDDEWLPAYLRVVMARADAHGLDVVCTNLLYHYDDGSERPGRRVFDTLAPEAFLTRNPGLIGSNLVVRRSVFAAVGGFDESLPCAEDMDFGVRLSLHGGVRYAPTRQWLVRHHHHAGPRLCMPRTEPMRTAVRRFFELHAPRMTPAQREEYRRSMCRVWGIDERGGLV